MFFRSLLYFLFICPILGFCDFRVNGRINAYNSKKITLLGWIGTYNKILSSSITDDNGLFNMNVKETYIGKMLLKLENGLIFNIFSDGNNITLLIDCKNYNKLYIFQSKINKELIKFFEYIQNSNINIQKNDFLSYYNTFFLYCNQEDIYDYMYKFFYLIIKNNVKTDIIIRNVQEKIYIFNYNDFIKMFIKYLRFIFINHTILLYTSGYYKNLQNIYIMLHILDYKNSNNTDCDLSTKIFNDINNIIYQVGYRTLRGKLLFLNFLNTLHDYGIDS